MPELPRGTVTFLLTDVEGSTALWEVAPESMHAAQARHDELFERSVLEHCGAHIRPRGEGDSRFAVFESALDALLAALDFQRALGTEQWQTPRPIKVRVGLHTGHADSRNGDYYGTAVNRCARIRDRGHGGETWLSSATVAVLRDDLPVGVLLRDRGEHRLDGLARTDRLFQLVDDAKASRRAPGQALVMASSGRHTLRRQRRRLVSSVAVLGLACMLGIVAIALWLPRTEMTLLTDDFDQPAHRALPEVSDFPREFAVGYGGGEYSIQTLSLTRNQIPSVLVPGWYADASLAVDARVIGDPERQSIVLGCHNIGPRSGYRLTVRPAQGTGSLDRSDNVPVLVRLAPLTNVAVIRRGSATNRLVLRCSDGQVTAQVNGTQVASVKDATYQAGRMWIGANVDEGTISFGHALFDNLVVRGVPAQIAVAEAVEGAALPADLPSEPN